MAKILKLEAGDLTYQIGAGDLTALPEKPVLLGVA